MTTLAQFDQALSAALDDDSSWLLDTRVDRDEIAWSVRGRADVLREDD
ncbi:hypothetical protein [Actinomadura nitritigenes]